MAFPEHLKALAQQQLQAQKESALRKRAELKAAMPQQMLRAEAASAPPRQQPAAGLQKIEPTGKISDFRKPNALGNSRYDALATDWASDETQQRLQAAGQSTEASAEAYKDYAAKRWDELKQGPSGNVDRFQDKDLSWTKRFAAGSGMAMPWTEDAINFFAPQTDEWHRVLKGEGSRDDKIGAAMDVAGLLTLGVGKAVGSGARVARTSSKAPRPTHYTTPEGVRVPRHLVDEPYVAKPAAQSSRTSSTRASSAADDTIDADALRDLHKSQAENLDPASANLKSLQDDLTPKKRETYRPMLVGPKKNIEESAIRNSFASKKYAKQQRLHEKYPVTREPSLLKNARDQWKVTHRPDGSLRPTVKGGVVLGTGIAAVSADQTMGNYSGRAWNALQSYLGGGGDPAEEYYGSDYSAYGYGLGGVLGAGQFGEDPGGWGSYYGGGGGGGGGGMAALRRNPNPGVGGIPSAYQGMYVNK